MGNEHGMQTDKKRGRHEEAEMTCGRKKSQSSNGSRYKKGVLNEGVLHRGISKMQSVQNHVHLFPPSTFFSFSFCPFLRLIDLCYLSSKTNMAHQNNDHLVQSDDPDYADNSIPWVGQGGKWSA